MALIDILKTLRDMLFIQQDGHNTPRIGQIIRAHIAPEPGRLTAQDLVTVPIDFDWFGKGVAFKDATMTDLTTLAPLPNINLLTVPPTAAQGVPGLIGKLTGNIDVPVQIPVYAIIKWYVKDKNNNVLVEGVDFLAPDGLTSPDVAIAFIPKFEKAMQGAVAGGRSLTLCADVIVGAGNVQTTSRTLPGIQFDVPSLFVPRLLLAAEHAEFEGALLAMVPASDWPAGTTPNTIIPLVNTLTEGLSSLASIAQQFATPLGGLELATRLLTTRPNITFKVTDGIQYLNDVTLIQNWLLQNDIEAEDELSSILLVGLETTSIACYIRDRYRTNEGSFTLRVGKKLFAAVHNLHSKTPASGPDGNELAVGTAPRDGLVTITTFGDSLSSMKFA